MSNKNTKLKCDEIEGMLKILNLENKQGKLNISQLALDQFNDVVMPALQEIRQTDKKQQAKIAELEEKLKPEDPKGGPVLVKDEEKEAVK